MRDCSACRRARPSLNIERISYLASGKVIEFTRSLYRGDAYDFVAELRTARTRQSSQEQDMMSMNTTHMRREIAEIPEAAARLLEGSARALAEAGSGYARARPALPDTVARGSSDHAAAFLKYAIELTAGVPVASLGPSIASIYGAKLKLDGAACLAISQSGKSPDIVAMAKPARAGGALTIAHHQHRRTRRWREPPTIAIDILAGAEKSVAATKTFVNSAVAGLALLGALDRTTTRCWRR